MKICPFKMANPALTTHYVPGDSCFIPQDWECVRVYCGLWNEHFGMCSFAVDAYLKGHEDSRRESKIDARD